MWKSNVKNIFHIACWPVGVSTGQNTWYASTRGFLIAADCAITYHFMPAHSRQSERQNIIARTHTWQQCSVSTSEAILTTKYGFNLRQNSPLNIENNTGYSGWIRVSVAHALIGPQDFTEVGTLLKRHTLVPSLLFLYIPLHDLSSAGETVLNATVPTSPPGDHSQVESPARGYCAKNSAYINKAGRNTIKANVRCFTVVSAIAEFWHTKFQHVRYVWFVESLQKHAKIHCQLPSRGLGSQQ